MFDALAGAILVRAAPKIAPKAPCLGPQSGFPVCVPIWARPVLHTAACSLAFYGADEYREAFDMALESCFEAFDADEVARRSHRHRIPS